jgi:predicted CxxxxCH...CXXCH cytochrome family protein
MKKLFSENKHIILIMAVAAVIFTFTGAEALDFPHNEQNFIGCDSCHYVLGTNESLMPDGLIFGLNIDDTQKNALCWSCHNDSDAPLVRTHSSLQTDNDYGDWTVECVACHNPHDQDMVQFYGDVVYVATGTSTDIQTDMPVAGQSQLTEAGNSWIPNAYVGYLLVPNTNYGEKFAYRILSNTADTITVEGIINPLWYFTGDPYGIMRGRLIRSSVNLETIIDPLNPQLGFRAVRHFNDDSDPGFPGNFPNSFSDGDGIDGICEVCHQETAYHRNNASGDHTHNLGAKCINCHSHLKGMKADCDVCHGEPPTTDDQVPPTGLVWNPAIGTGSTTAGAHNLHVNTMLYGCETCHVDSVGSGPTHNNSLIVTIGFSMFGGTQEGGDYVGQPAVSYNTTSTVPPTTAISGTGGPGDKTCSNIYCHGDYNGSGLNASPVWDNPASVSCGTCHDASNSADSAPDSGSHEKHADSDQTINTVPKTTFNRNYECILCHEGIVGGSGPSSYTIADTTKHVNGYVNWNFDAGDSRTAIGAPSYSIASGTAEPSDGTTPRAYGTCTVYCHSNGVRSAAVGYNSYLWRLP